MKTPDEIKKGLNCNNIDHCNDCPYDGLDCVKHVDQDALAYIQQLERKLEEEHEMCEFYRAKDKRQGSIISQVSKALCGKENTTYDEFSRAVSQVKSRLAQVERERDALMEYAKGCCETCAFVGDCAKHDPDPTSPGAWWYDDCEEWQWRGVCNKNTKEEKNG